MAEQGSKLYRVSSSPHLVDRSTVDRIMLDVILALTPALLWAVWVFGLRALWVTLASVAGSVIAEAACRKLMGREQTLDDYSAVVTGMLLAYAITPLAPLWMGFIGGAVSIVIGKQLFGGLGYNIFNPALVGRAVLLASWPLEATAYAFSREAAAAMTAAVRAVPDALTGATPLTAVREAGGAQAPYLDLFIGNVGGSIGEVSALLILLGGAYLIYRRVIHWHTPVVFIGVVAVLSALAGRDPLFHVLAGGLMLGAFFMATDMVTTPITVKGQMIFAVGCGIIVVLVRNFGAFPEGVCYSILIMNMATPLIDRYIKPGRFGAVKPE